MGCRNLAPAVWNNQTTTKHLSAFHSFIWTALILKPQTSRNLRLWEWVLFWSLLPPERHSRWILFWHSADPSWTDFIMKKKLFSFFCFVLFCFFLLFFLFTLPLLSFPFLSLDGSAALGGVVSFEPCSFLNSIQIVQMWKTPTDLIIPDIALSRTHSSFVDESCLPDYFSVKPGMFCCRKRKRKSTFKGSSVSLKHL